MKINLLTAIEISDTQIRLFQSMPGNEARVLTFFEARDIFALPEDGIIKTLQNMTSSPGFRRGGEIVAVIPRQSVLVRTLTLPSKDPEEIRAMADLQIGQHIPFDRDEIVMDQVAGIVMGDGQTQVMTVIAHNERMLALWRILTASGFPRYRMTLSSLGIVSWYRRSLLTLNEVVIVVNIDEHNSEICICDQHQIYALRTANWGAEDNQTHQPAELVYKLELTLESYKKNNFGKDISSILIVSSFEKDFGLCEVLIKELGLPVGYKCAIPEVSRKKTVAWPRVVINGGSSIVPGLGSVLFDVPQEVDLIPTMIKNARSKNEKSRLVIRICTIGVIALLALSLAFSIGFIKQNKTLSNVEAEISQLKPQVAKIKKKAGQIQEFRGVLSGRIVFSKIIRELDRLIPSGMSLLEFSISDGSTLILQGVSHDARSINQLQKDMADSGIFSNVQLNFVNKRVLDQGESNFFKLTCQVKATDDL